MKNLEYVYTGTADFEADRRFYLELISAELIWEFERFGARVAAFALTGTKPWIILADHEPAGYRRLIFAVDSLEKAKRELQGKGLVFTSGVFGIPDGPCINFQDASGNLYAIMEKQKPDEYLVDEYMRQQAEKAKDR